MAENVNLDPALIDGWCKTVRAVALKGSDQILRKLVVAMLGGGSGGELPRVPGGEPYDPDNQAQDAALRKRVAHGVIANTHGTNAAREEWDREHGISVKRPHYLGA